MFRYFSKAEKLCLVFVAVSIVLLLANVIWGKPTVFTNISVLLNASVLGCMTGIHSTRKEKAEKKQE